MPRIPNTRPTTIYWLFDMRPETLVTMPNGRPFYCGKTVLKPSARFDKHRSDARKYPDKDIAKRLSECGEHVQIRIVEVVPVECDWAERERFWISTLRLFYPDAVNITAGGQGMPGHVPTAETRAKRSASLKGRVFSAEHRAKIGIASSNRAPEVYAKISASQIGKTISVEHRAKLSAAGKGRKFSPETIARMREAAKLRDPETYARGPMPAETRAKISASHMGIRPTDETREKLRAGAQRRVARRALESAVTEGAQA